MARPSLASEHLEDDDMQQSTSPAAGTRRDNVQRRRAATAAVAEHDDGGGVGDVRCVELVASALDSAPSDSNGGDA